MATKTQLNQESTQQPEMDLANAPSFIEHQFPVAKVSMESFAERRSNQSQSITSLGKWWGRKPLVLVRATLLGVLLPNSSDPIKDREVFLKLMTMDEEGLRRRKDKSIPGKRIVEELLKMPPSVSTQYLDQASPPHKAKLRRSLSRDERRYLQELVYDRMAYSEKLKFCCRPEELDGPAPEAWRQLNEHLGTNSSSLQELVLELGFRRFGRSVRAGDAFCGAGSIPFELARLGCETFGSDLSPVAALLTWASLNIVGGGKAVVESVEKAQQLVYERAKKQLVAWGVEENSDGWCIDAMLYCTEVRCPETDWIVPLAPHWVVAPTSRVVATLVPNRNAKRYDIELVENATEEEIDAARNSGTIQGGYVTHPVLLEKEKDPAPLDMIRAANRNSDKQSLYHESGVRLWDAADIVPRDDDVFQERLYCIRWEETYFEYSVDDEVVELSKADALKLDGYDELIKSGTLKRRTRRHYRSPDNADLQRENQVLSLLQERWGDWQSNGYVPSRSIEPGYNTSQPIRERGWCYWHQLFTPRQLLTIGLLQEIATAEITNTAERVAVLLSIGRFADWNSKLCRWGTGAARESIGQTFTNQALNTMLTFASKGFGLSAGTWFMSLNPESFRNLVKCQPCDARTADFECDIWITDPPYADAVNYHEVSEYFLAWYGNAIERIFPQWSRDSRRQLAVKGNDNDFRQSMVQCYRSMTEHMPMNGVQVVMFTHQDASVWADLATILWASGLHVTAAWCIQTEREAAGVREGNYVQGTVIMILRKRKHESPVFLDEIAYGVESEVRSQLDAMLTLDDDSDQNFSDADYQLAAYAAALRVITERPIEDIDPEREITRDRQAGEVSPIEEIIRNAVKIACDHLVPKNIDRDMWKTYSPMERFYLKGLEVETHGERRSGVYQELARGFGALNYDDLLASTRANETRLKSASEFGKRMLSGDAPFAGSLTRHVLYAVHTITKNGEVAGGINWLKTELPNYWDVRLKAIVLLDFFAKLDSVSGMEHWKDDCDSARLLAGALRNDHG